MGGGWGDYDNDGFLDLFVTETHGNNALYHNVGNTNHWIKFQFEGTVANRTAIGAKVRLKATIGGQTFWQMREVSGGNFCQNDLRPNFGLGEATNVDLVRIEWPSGIVQEFQNVAADQFLTVTEPSQLVATGSGQLQIRSWKGMSYEVQASTNLIDWSPVGTVTNLDGTLRFTDPGAASQTQRFYRTLTK